MYNYANDGSLDTSIFTKESLLIPRFMLGTATVASVAVLLPFFIGFVPSALVTGTGHGAFYIEPVFNREETTPEARLQRLAESLNRIVHDTSHHADLVAAMALVEIDLMSHRIYYPNMGHCPAIFLSKNKAHMVRAMGSLLSLHENIVIKVKEYQAAPSDIFARLHRWLAGKLQAW